MAENKYFIPSHIYFFYLLLAGYNFFIPGHNFSFNQVMAIKTGTWKS